MTMERTSAKHAKDQAHDPYACTVCGYVLQVPVGDAYRSKPTCPRCALSSWVTLHKAEGGE